MQTLEIQSTPTHYFIEVERATLRLGPMVLQRAGKPVGAFMGTSLTQRFESLASEWRAETSHFSSTTKIVLHPSYQRIIGLGPAAIGLILQDLQQTHDHWFWALDAITGVNPISTEDAGDVDKMAQAWLRWGQREGYL